MKKYKALYYAMYDDLKDADMLIDDAYCIRKENVNDQPLADELAKYSNERMNHFDSFHTLFMKEAETSMVQQETVSVCLWEETHEHMVEWAEDIKKKIKQY